MTTTCAVCGSERQPGGLLRPTLNPAYQQGHCFQCRTVRLFVTAPAGLGDDHGQARATDPPTAHAAARRIRTGSAKRSLLEAHASHPAGLTDEEAAELAGLSLTSEYATRCSELMRAGLLVDTTDTRTGSAGMQRLVRQITAAGEEVAR